MDHTHEQQVRARPSRISTQRRTDTQLPPAADKDTYSRSVTPYSSLLTGSHVDQNETVRLLGVRHRELKILVGKA